MARRRKIPTPSWEHEQSQLTRRLDTNAWQLWITGAVILLIIIAVGIVGFGFLSDYVADQRRPGSVGLQVEDRKYSVEDFTSRVEGYVEDFGNNSAAIVIPTISRAIIEELIVLQYASERNVTATDDEVRAQLGTQLSLALDDPNFDARIQEEIVGSGLSEEQFYDVARAAVLRRNIIESFKADVPGTLPAVHYRQIQVADQATADSLVEQLNDGADFIALAEKNSEDSATKALGGDKGFVPEGLLDEATEDLLFSLEVNEFATFPTTSAVFVYEVLEKSDDYDVTNEQVESLAQNAYLEWRTDKEETLDIKNEFDFTDGDGDKIQYVIDHAGLALS